MKSKFRAFVRELDADALDELRRSVAQEMEGRRQKDAVKIEDIHPRMTAEEKQRVMDEIARALRGGNDA